MPDPYFQYKSIKEQLKEIESVIRASLFIILVYYKESSSYDIWWLMDKEQRLLLLLDEARALQAHKAVNLKGKAKR